MKKFIVKVDLHDNKEKRKALKIVAALSGIDSVTVNMKDKTLVVVGTVDPINVVSKLRKFWPADIVLVGPAKEPEKKEDAKKDDGKKEDAKKDDGKKEDGKKEEGKADEAKKEDGKKDDASKEESKKKEGDKGEEKKKKVELAMPQPMPGMYMPYRPYNHPINTYYNSYQQYQPYPQYQPYQQYPTYQPYQQRHLSIEENPNGCVIS